MLHVSPLVEALRARPRLVFWTAALTQATLWTLVPTLFYPSPPGDLPQLLTIGHEWRAGSAYGPPLSFWLAEIAFTLAGGRVFGVYLLAQACVLVTFWAVFALAGAVVGARHAAMAILLMAGVVVFAAPTVEFGPAVVGMPLAALAILHFWRALGQGRQAYWLALGLELGLMTLATPAGFIYLALVALFAAATARGRANLAAAEPWAGLMIAAFVASPYLIWLSQQAFRPPLDSLLAMVREMAALHVMDWLRLAAIVLVAHIGVVVFVATAAKNAKGEPEAPAIERLPVEGFAKTFVYYFAVAPALTGIFLAILFGWSAPAGGSAPLIVLTALAVIVAAGDVIRLRRERVLGWTWAVMLVGPALLAVSAIAVLPWTIGTTLRVNEPAAAMARFFTDSFNRRTGKPLGIVIGDARIASLVALASRDRPRVLFDASPRFSPWIDEADIREKGAIVVWQITDPAGAPPSAIRAHFPDLVPEVPRAFERPVQGRLPLIRIGWAMIRPASANTTGGGQ